MATIDDMKLIYSLPY